MAPGKHIFRFHKGYCLLALFLVVVEILIGAYMHDTYIRPVGGDYLVVILLYCFIRSFTNLSVPVVAVCVLLFSYAIEISQYFNYADILGFHRPSLIRTLLGYSFSWGDMLAYTLGIGTVIACEQWRVEQNKRRLYGQVRG